MKIAEEVRGLKGGDRITGCAPDSYFKGGIISQVDISLLKGGYG